jgi:hypothetical protein
LLRARWRTFAILAGTTVLVSLAVAAIWLRFDMRAMPAIEHYSPSGWYLALLPGIFVVGALTLIASLLARITRAINRRAARTT